MYSVGGLHLPAGICYSTQLAADEWSYLQILCFGDVHFTLQQPWLAAMLFTDTVIDRRRMDIYGSKPMAATAEKQARKAATSRKHTYRIVFIQVKQNSPETITISLTVNAGKLQLTPLLNSNSGAHLSFLYLVVCIKLIGNSSNVDDERISGWFKCCIRRRRRNINWTYAQP